MSKALRPSDPVATVRLVDFSPTLHAVTEKGLEGQHATFCGRDAEGYVYGDGHAEDITCHNCLRIAMRGS